jgi:hypothetical protein
MCMLCTVLMAYRQDGKRRLSADVCALSGKLQLGSLMSLQIHRRFRITAHDGVRLRLHPLLPKGSITRPAKNLAATGLTEHDRTIWPAREQRLE